MNPITALSEQFQKLITEHGAAAILRDHLSYIRDQLSATEKQFSILQKENEALKLENAHLEQKVEEFEKHNNRPRNFTEPVIAKTDFDVFEDT